MNTTAIKSVTIAPTDTLVNYFVPGSSGYTCGGCGCWVPYGTVHNCFNSYPQYTYTAPQTDWMLVAEINGLRQAIKDLAEALASVTDRLDNMHEEVCGCQCERSADQTSDTRGDREHEVTSIRPFEEVDDFSPPRWEL